MRCDAAGMHLYNSHVIIGMEECWKSPRNKSPLRHMHKLKDVPRRRFPAPRRSEFDARVGEKTCPSPQGQEPHPRYSSNFSRTNIHERCRGCWLYCFASIHSTDDPTWVRKLALRSRKSVWMRGRPKRESEREIERRRTAWSGKRAKGEIITGLNGQHPCSN